MNNSSDPLARLFLLSDPAAQCGAPDVRADEPELKEMVLRDYPPCILETA